MTPLCAVPAQEFRGSSTVTVAFDAALQEKMMTFTTASLPNNGVTSHFAVSYDDSLPSARGLDIARDLLNYCEVDLALIESWFTGVSFQFAFPINVQITGDSDGASWTDPPDVALWFGFHPSVTIAPGPRPTTGLVRFLIVAEVTEMFMASQRKWWFGNTTFTGADEGSMGESLSRFLADQFLSATGVSKAIFPGFGVVSIWLNSATRPNFVDVAPDDISPDETTGCGTCFIFFLKDQLGFTIQQIIGASGPTLAAVYTNLTGKTDAWSAFRNLVDLHYPLGGSKHFPPLDDIFPVADLTDFWAPAVISWVFNDTPNLARIILDHAVPADVDIALTSDDTTAIAVPGSVMISDSSFVPLDVKVQGAAFTPRTVNLSASYAGTVISVPVQVVPPADLPVAPLVIQPVTGNDPCGQKFVAGTTQDFEVKNPGVLREQQGLTYRWTVIGAPAQDPTAEILVIPALPAPGTAVTIQVTVQNADGIQAHGELEFTTATLVVGLAEQVRHLNCSISWLKFVNNRIPVNVPIEETPIGESLDQLTLVETGARQLAAAAENVLALVRATREGLEESNPVADGQELSSQR